MNIKKALREALTKKPKRQYDYGCVMINLNLDTKEWNNIQEMIDDKDIYNGEEGEEGGFGRELDPHVTVLFGVHADVPDEDVETLIDKVTTPEIEMQKISSFTNKLFDVLKFDIESEDLNKLNEMFKTLPYTSDYPDYHPHATICYLKKGKAEKYVKKMADIDPLNVKPSELTYSKPNGKKKNYDI